MTAEARAFCQAFLDAPVQRRFLFGVNEYARMLADHIEIAGFVDDIRAPMSVGKWPVLRRKDTPNDALVVSTLLGRPLTGRTLLDEYGFRHLDFFGFYDHCGLELPAVRFWGAHRDDLESNADRYTWLESQLQEPASLEVFHKLSQLRRTGDLASLDGFTERQDEQYFEDFLEYRSGQEVFVDVGAYDGATTEEFIRRCPDYRAALVFEPEARNAELAEARLSKFERVKVIRKGLASASGTALISADGSSSSIGPSGGEEIELVRLDDYVDEPVTFVKMDIEGFEREALAGAGEVIRRYRPKLAIAVYHHAEDLWAIPELVLSLEDSYELRLRHYTEGVVETVMFFLPR